MATAGTITAGERPNPTLSVAPGFNSTTAIPSPWIMTPSLDIPIETAGKRGYAVHPGIQEVVPQKTADQAIAASLMILKIESSTS